MISEPYAPLVSYRGFNTPVSDMQTVFRALMDAMATPAQKFSIDAECEGPAGLDSILAAVGLTLLDTATKVWADGKVVDKKAMAFFRHHSHVLFEVEPADVDFAIISCGDESAAVLASLPRGTKAEPEGSATAIVVVPAGDEIVYRARGPGIEHEILLALPVAVSSLIATSQSINAVFPLGVDLILCLDDGIVGLPRTTRLEKCRTQS